MDYVTGKLLTDKGFVSGHLGFEEGVIKEVGRGPKRGALAKGLILPSLVNAHTHLGDAFLRARFRRYRGERSIEAVFAPPSGYKHRELARAPKGSLVRGIRRSLREMLRGGSKRFCDFREGGVAGAKAIREARRGIGIEGLVLGRPAALRYDKAELDGLLGLCDGVAVSAVSDWEYPELEKVSAHVRSAGRMFALHASEVVREDIDKVLSLKPRFLVHMVKAEEYDLERVAAEGVPVVVCPRANALFGLRPRMDLMRGFGVEVALGSDNAMLHPPEMLPVVQSAWETVRGSGMTPRQVLDIAIGGARKILNLTERMPFTPGMPAEFFVVENPRMYSAGDPVAELVRRGGAASVALASLGERIWTRGR